MKSDCQQIVDDNGIGLFVHFSYKKDYYTEECHGIHTMTDVEVKLNLVSLCLHDERKPGQEPRVIDILPLLHEGEKELIISKLTID